MINSCKLLHSGHFSPLAAYHSGTDRVLIMDVARFKYPPHWITLEQLQTAMNSEDPTTKKVRGRSIFIHSELCDSGYVTLKLKANSRPLVIFGLKCNLSHNEAQVRFSINYTIGKIHFPIKKLF